MGIRGKVRRSTLADANELRDWRIYAELAHALIATARDLYRTEIFLAELNETVYVLAIVQAFPCESAGRR